MTPIQEVKMNMAIEKDKERGAVEAELMLTKMVFIDQELYEKILDSDFAYYFNELCKKAIAYDKLEQNIN